MPNIVCSIPLCPNAATVGGRCAMHVRERDRQKRKYAADRDVYDSANWQRARIRQLRRHPLCEDPLGLHAGERVPIATHVHHVEPLSQGGPKRGGELQSLCPRCHAAVHKALRSGEGRDGSPL